MSQDEGVEITPLNIVTEISLHYHCHKMSYRMEDQSTVCVCVWSGHVCEGAGTQLTWSLERESVEVLTLSCAEYDEVTIATVHTLTLA